MSEKLTIRQRQILGILNSQKERISGREIAEYLNVTDRTIRTDIQILTGYLHPLGVEIDAIRGKGYLLKSQDSALMQSLVYQEGAMLTPDDRIRALTVILLESSDPVDIDDLAEECFASRSTIEHDLKVIAFEYEREQPHIRLLRRKNTVQLEEDEWKRRYVMNMLYVRRWNYNYEAGILMSDLPVSNEEMTLIGESLTSSLSTFGISMTEHDHVSFLFSIAIALRRIRMGFPIGTSSAGGTARTMKAVEAVLSALEARTGVTFSNAECSTLSDEMAHRQQYKEDSFSRDLVGGPAPAGNAAYLTLISQILLEADEEFGSTFSENEPLKGELLNILITQTHNPFHPGLRDEYVTRRMRTESPDAVELACRIEEALREYRKEELTENFLFELVAVFAEAIEEDFIQKTQSGIPVMIISHMTDGATRVLMTQIRRFFGTRVKLLGPIPVYDALRNGCRGADLVVATTKMKPSDLSLPYLTIPRMMDKKNMERMNFLLSLEKYRRLYGGEGRWIIHHLEEFRVIKGLQAKGHYDTLRKLTDILVEEGLAGESFADDVARRERQTSTSFREGFALPHAMHTAANKSGLFLLLLDSTIDWGGIQVDQIFLLFLKEDQLKSRMRIYSCLVYMLRRLRAQKILQEINDGAELKNLLESIEVRG